MLYKELIELFDMLDSAAASGSEVVEYFKSINHRGFAITTETIVAGCATGSVHIEDMDDAARFMIESAKTFGKGKLNFLDEEEFARIRTLYGNMEHFQTMGRKREEA